MPDAVAPARIARPDGWQVLKRNRAAVIALGFLIALSLIAIVVPMLLPAELKVTSSASFVPPLQHAAENHTLHVLGTDVNGQDMLYRLLSGARVSLGVGLVGALISLIIGTLYGMISGYAGGRLDGIMMRTVEVLQSVPRILFIMILIAALDDYVKEWIDGWRLLA
ncbi:MAG TPA: ABC transporter permease, partial [Prosthecobacter sp.]|nr:ABC transporter permease [Prosthecobacter sp.]